MTNNNPYCHQQEVKLKGKTVVMKSKKREKNPPISISPETCSSPVCYADKKEEMREGFQDE